MNRIDLACVFCAGCEERIGWTMEDQVSLLPVLYCDLCRKNEAWREQEGGK